MGKTEEYNPYKHGSSHPLKQEQDCKTFTKSSASSILFSVPDKVGALEEALQTLKNNNINLTHIESRPSNKSEHDYDFFVNFDSSCENEQIEKAIKALTDNGSEVTKLGQHSNAAESSVPWFPRKISDMDSFADKTLEMGEELSADHPGFTDENYRNRREKIVDLAKKFKHGHDIAIIEYTQEENDTWKAVYSSLKKMYPTHACAEHNKVFPLLEKFCGYGPDKIPQLEPISKFLQETTGWRLKPVMGLLSPRDFLNALAFRVFHSTQYIRHHSKPLYTPEPDVCHELLGHVPLFADPDFADFSQQIGLASLGVSDEDIEKLATCYWFTIEFGICKQNGENKAYGAGLLSSFGELEYCLSDKPQLKPFDPPMVAVTEYPITEYQPLYFVTSSFQDAKEKLLRYAATLDRPFSIRYNPYTLSVEILDSKEKLSSYAASIASDAANLREALNKI